MKSIARSMASVNVFSRQKCRIGLIVACLLSTKVI